VVAQPRGSCRAPLGEGYGKHEAVDVATQEQSARERAAIASEFDPAEITHGRHGTGAPSVLVAFLPLIVVILVNLAMSLFVLPRLDTSYLTEARWGGTSLAAVGGVWAVLVALFAAILTLIALNYRRLPSLRESMDAGANASVLPAFSVGSLVGFGAVIAALPAFTLVRDWVLSIGGGPLVSLAVATNILAALTGSAAGGLTIALDALGETYLRLASEHGIDPALLHRVAVMSAGTLDSLPHNGAVVTLLAVCGMTHRDSYKDLFAWPSLARSSLLPPSSSWVRSSGRSELGSMPWPPIAKPTPCSPFARRSSLRRRFILGDRSSPPSPSRSS
jgi:H+/gluconate symporter-like permease